MRRIGLLGVVMGVMALMAAMPAPSAAGTGTVRANVRYQTADGSEPLAGVEVFLGFLSGRTSRFACTDESGIATFTDVPSGVGLMSATGVAVSPLRDDPCITNPDFLRPGTTKKLTNVFWRDHHGAIELDRFMVGAGKTVTLKFVAKTPVKQRRICGGMWATWVGTSGADTHAGTPKADVLAAGAGNDRIDGGGGGDSICGGLGGDVLKGAGGPDWIWGDKGNDSLVGGLGTTS